MQKLTTKHVKEIVKKTGCILISEYKNKRTKIKIQCQKCNFVRLAWYDDLRKGARCLKCSGNLTKDINDIKVFIESKNGTLLTFKYINNRTPLYIKCNACKNVFKSNGGTLKQNKWCRHCLKLSLKEAQQTALKRGGTCLSKIYQNNRTKMQWKCSKGHVWHATLANVKARSWCPYCKESLGEKAISQFLKTHNIMFIREKRFKTCRDKLPLPFDFYLPQLNALIEFDGIQHYYKQSYYYSETLVLHDQIKTKWAKKTI